METYRKDFTDFVNSLITKDMNDKSLMRDLYYFFTNERNYIWREFMKALLNTHQKNQLPLFSQKIYTQLCSFFQKINEDVEKSYNLIR